MKCLMLFFITLTLSAFTNFGADPSAAGTWKWTLTEQTGETILKLKQEREKLTGSYTNQFGAAEIRDGTLQDGKISFKVKRDFNGQEFVIQYSGKLSGDKITGQAAFDMNGETREMKWEAKREASAKLASGTWNTALILDNGNRIEGTLRLKQEGDKLTGAAARNENETTIQDGKIVGNEVTFTVVREREGRKVTAKYKGKVSGDNIKGTVESDWSGAWQTLDWEGTRGK